MKFSQLAQKNACKITLPVEMVMTQTPTLRAAILQQIDTGMTQLLLTCIRFTTSILVASPY